MSEPFNSIVLVLAGALFGAWFAGCWCGCLPRWRWRRSWRKLVENNGGVFEEEAACRRDQTARFHACQAERRTQERAAHLKEGAR
jgi:hypothetical protein